MNFGDLKTLARAYVPQATVRVITNDVLELILNEAALDVATRTHCLKAVGTFNVTASDGEYNLSDELTRYLMLLEPGIWWNNGTNWIELDPKTMDFMDERYP